MHLIQLLLPLYDNEGARFPAAHFEQVVQELTDRFGGLTAYSRAPAAGLWEEKPGQTKRDDLVVYEVMAEELDAQWWKHYRFTLEERFDQDELVVRALQIRKL
jgi:hypothetical protein